MLRHVALFRFVPDATAEQIQAVTDGLRSLPAQIPELLSYHVGADVGADVGVNDANFDFAVVADFDDAESYQIYVAHPAHEEIAATRVRPILAERAMVQYELEG